MSDAISSKRDRTNQRGHREQAEVGSHKRTWLSVPVLLFLFSLIIPLSFFVGQLRFTPYRVLLVGLFFPLVVGWLGGKAGRIRLADISVMMMCLWYTLALFVNESFNALQASGIFLIETLGSYLLARCAIRTAADFHHMVKWLFRVVIFLLPFALYEALTSHNIILDVFNRIGTSYYDVYKDPRWGLDRVQGPFEHPILFGVFCGGALALSYYVLGYGNRFLKRIMRLLLVFFTAAFTLSSGPVTSFIAQIGLIGWDVLLKRVRSRWWILLGLVSTVWTALSLASNRSVPALFIAVFAFNSWTASYRLLIWQFGSASVLDNPVFGIGLSDQWARPYWLGSSIDMYWLLWAMRIGIPGAFFILFALGAATIGVISTKITDTKIDAYRSGFVIVMMGFFLAGWTVHYWNATHVLFMFLLGSGAWIQDVPSNTTSSGKEPAVRKGHVTQRSAPHTRIRPRTGKLRRNPTSHGKAGSCRTARDE